MICCKLIVSEEQDQFIKYYKENLEPKSNFQFSNLKEFKSACSSKNITCCENTTCCENKSVVH